MSILFGNSFTCKLHARRARFEHGLLTPRHKHSYVELIYIIEEKYQQRIDWRDEMFNHGEVCLIGKDTSHEEYQYHQDAKVLFLGISNAFFDKSMPLETGAPEGQKFLRDVILDRDDKYHFVRFTPQKSETVISRLFEAILSELRRHEPGTCYLGMGYTASLLHRLSVDYEAHVQARTRQATAKCQFEQAKQYLDQHYTDTSLEQLASVFNYTSDYFNRLIKRCPGMTYLRFLQDIRLEKATILLKTTQFTVEDIARRVGYENQTYFYHIFHEKFHTKPDGLRCSPPSILQDDISILPASETSMAIPISSMCIPGTSRGAPETSRGASETSRFIPGTSRGASETSRGTHETSRCIPETSRGASETSRGIHEIFRTSLKTPWNALNGVINAFF